MLFNKIPLAAAALSMISWMSTPVFAGHNSLGHANGHGHKVGTSEVSTEGTGHHGGTKGHGHHHDACDNTHSNKGGALRGLDRANQAGQRLSPSFQRCRPVARRRRVAPHRRVSAAINVCPARRAPRRSEVQRQLEKVVIDEIAMLEQDGRGGALDCRIRVRVDGPEPRRHRA
jgi:hypothetical protein